MRARQPAPMNAQSRAVVNALGAGVVLVGVVSMLLISRQNADVDLGLHLSVGRYLVEQGLTWDPGAVRPITGLEDQAYVPTQWLAQIIGYVGWSIGGHDAILALRLVCLVGVGAAVVWANRSVSTPTPALVATVFTMFGTAMAWGERPQLAGLAAFALVSALLWRSRSTPRWSWLVVPVIWTWSMLHGTWIIGVSLIVVFALGRVLERDVHGGIQLGVQAVLGIIAAAANPLGLATVWAPFDVAEAAGPEVNEWAAPALTNPFLISVIVAGLVILRMWFRRRPMPTEILVLIFSLLLAFSMVRLVAFGAVAMSPILATALTSLPEGRPLSAHFERRYWFWLAAASLAVGVLVSMLAPPRLPLSPTLESSIDGLPTGSRVAVEPRLSGWVLWNHPDLIVLKDLRAEVYSPSTTSAYERFNAAEPGWEAYADSHDIQAVLVDVNEPLSDALSQAASWTLVSSDEDSQLWLKDS